MTEFEVNDVYQLLQPLAGIEGLVRIVDHHSSKGVVLTLCDPKRNRASNPRVVAEEAWIAHLSNGGAAPAEDPYFNTPKPLNQTPKVKERMKKIDAAVDMVMADKSVLFYEHRLHEVAKKAAAKTEMSVDTVHRWINEWLRCGFTTYTLCQGQKGRNPQKSVKKRGRRGPVGYDSNVPLPEIRDRQVLYAGMALRGKMTVEEAYHEMLIHAFKIPSKVFEIPSDGNTVDPDRRGLFLTPALIEKYRPPTFGQFRYTFRQEKKKHLLSLGGEAPRGSRGRAIDGISGPGYFEIDATTIQVQLVSRFSRADLVGRPLVYLMVDKFSTAVVGYFITQENASWAAAALALLNCFTDKKEVFDRLGMPYNSSDWPAMQLPTDLTADRAELISNQGQEFARSGIKVTVTPAMCPIAKGTVEGKHSELKRWQKTHLDLLGAYAKVRKRRESDGKKTAALNIHEFEQMIVEAILILNRQPVGIKNIPHEALTEGRKVGTRIGLYEWGLKHRPGSTRAMPPNFAYEHLFTKGTASYTRLGLTLREQIYTCDRLRTKAWAMQATPSRKMPIVYHPLDASRIYFWDEEAWHAALLAHHIDYVPDVDSPYGMSFAELNEVQAHKTRIRSQAKSDSQFASVDARNAMNGLIVNAREERKQAGKAPKGKVAIRANRTREQQANRLLIADRLNKSGATSDVATSLGPSAAPSASAHQVPALEKSNPTLDTPPNDQAQRKRTSALALWPKAGSSTA